MGRVGVPQDETMPVPMPTFFRNVTISGGPAPARAYMDALLPDVLEGRIEPGKVFDFFRPAGLRARGLPGYECTDSNQGDDRILGENPMEYIRFGNTGMKVSRIWCA